MDYRAKNRHYNTKTGTLIISRKDLRYPFKNSEAAYYEADLYRNKGGEYFLHGSGGILSIFKGFKDKIIPLNRDFAKIVGRDFMNQKAYQQEFL
jgi:hypothetical protein